MDYICKVCGFPSEKDTGDPWFYRVLFCKEHADIWLASGLTDYTGFVAGKYPELTNIIKSTVDGDF